jgi:hypothetical protein
MFSKTSIALRVVGLVLGFLVGLRVSSAEYRAPNLPVSLYEPRHDIDEFDLVLFTLIVAGLFKILNYFFNENGNAGISEFLVAMLGGIIFGTVFYKVIPTIYHWVF